MNEELHKFVAGKLQLSHQYLRVNWKVLANLKSQQVGWSREVG